MIKTDGVYCVPAAPRLPQQPSPRVPISLTERTAVIFCCFREGDKPNPPPKSPRKTQQQALPKLPDLVSVFLPSSVNKDCEEEAGALRAQRARATPRNLPPVRPPQTPRGWTLRFRGSRAVKDPSTT